MLFGEGQYVLKMLLAFVAVFGFLALALWLVRRFGSERLSNASARGRQPRLAVIDNASVDGRRRLVLIRRDNVEHLLMIGGPTDVVIEPNILRAAGTAPRELSTPRASSGGDTLPRPVPLNDGAMWPLQPEPAARIEPSLRPEPPARVPRSGAAAAAEDASDWAEPAAPPPSQSGRDRRARAEPLAGLAEELSRAADGGENERPPPPPPRSVPRRDGRSRPPTMPVGGPTGEPKPASAADHNLADMAQRLEAALRRPAKADDTRSENEKAETLEVEVEPTTAAIPPNRIAAAEVSKTSRPDTRVARSEAKPGPNSLYDSLEQEMASLLGRPGKA